MHLLSHSILLNNSIFLYVGVEWGSTNPVALIIFNFMAILRARLARPPPRRVLVQIDVTQKVCVICATIFNVIFVSYLFVLLPVGRAIT